MADEKVLGIKLLGKAETKAAAETAKSDLKGIEKQQKDSAKEAADAVKQAADIIANAHKKSADAAKDAAKISLDEYERKFKDIREVAGLSFLAVGGVIGYAVKVAAQSGEFDTLKTSVNGAMKEIGNAFIPVLEKGIDKIVTIANKVAEFAHQHQQMTLILGGSIGTIAAVAFVVSSTAIVFVQLKKAIEGVQLAVTLLSKNPWMAAIGLALAVATPFLLSWIDKITTSAEKQKDWNTEIQEGTQFLDEFLSGVKAGPLTFDQYNQSLTKLTQGHSLADLKLQQVAFRDMLKSTDAGIQAFAIGELERINSEIEKTLEIARQGRTDLIKPSDMSDLRAGVIDVDAMEASQNAALALQDEFNAKMLTASERVNQEQAGAELLLFREKEEKKRQLYEDTYNTLNTYTQSLQAAYSTSVDSMLNSDMNWNQRRTAIWNSFKTTAIKQIADVLKEQIFAGLAKQALDKQTAAVSISSLAITIAHEVAAAARIALAWMAVTYAKMTAWYASFSGPFAPFLALGSMAAAFAGIAAITSRALHFAQGGIVPGSGLGDRVPAMLSPGERVISVSQYRANQGNIERAIQGGRSGDTHFNVNVDFDTERLRNMFRVWLKPELEDLIERGDFRYKLASQ